MGVVYLVLIAETEDDLIKRLSEWKDNMQNRDMRVNMNKTKVMISAEQQKVMQKAVRCPCVVYADRNSNSRPSANFCCFSSQMAVYLLYMMKMAIIKYFKFSFTENC